MIREDNPRVIGNIFESFRWFCLLFRWFHWVLKMLEVFRRTCKSFWGPIGGSCVNTRSRGPGCGLRSQLAVSSLHYWTFYKSFVVVVTEEVLGFI